MPQSESAARAGTSLVPCSIGAGEHKNMFYDAVLNGHPVVVQLYPGVTHVFMSQNAAKISGLHADETAADVQLGYHLFVKASRSLSAYLELNGYRTLLDVFRLSIPGSVERQPSVILGKQ